MGRRRRWLLVLGALGLAVAASGITATAVHLGLPQPTGPHAVGRTVGTAAGLPLTAWYPAEPGTGTDAAYVADLEALRDGLVASGELTALEVAGLGLVRDPALAGAEWSTAQPRWPVVLLSPGNATNVAFYAALAEDVASRGFAVLGVDHPGQSTAVLVGGEVVVYEGDAARSQAARVEQRVADLHAVLDRLPTLPFAASLDLDRVAALGHSNGGLAAAALCAEPAEVRACANLDGQGAAGPFGVDLAPPDGDFLFLTKETALHPVLADVFEAAGARAYRVTVPAARHDDLGDGGLITPGLWPLDRRADRVHTVTSGFVAAFLDIALRGAPRSVLGDVPATVDVQVAVYPLRR